MIDGGIVDYADNCEYIPGCETCDYGSQYITEIIITLTKYKIHVKLNEMYNYALSESGIMKVILPEYGNIRAMTEKEFSGWLKNRLIGLMKAEGGCLDVDDAMELYHVEKMLEK